ncbi:MAG: hypothetical protein A3J70_11855 [Elusimicrobia bacterium RIFCSPHIGHO2_02_FULL_61_10]|nr:MAG: hypothetical protein A3J70_11855 [Elusimicrobia bacterium RIFCSPHIGHO2_02_FULL_61_10]
MGKPSLFGKIWRALGSFFLVGGTHGTVRLEKTVYAPDGKHRVCFFRRDEDGVWGFREESFDDKILEMNWLPVSKEPSEEYEDMESAAAAARAEIVWFNLLP